MSKRKFGLLNAAIVRQGLNPETRRWETVEPRIEIPVVSEHLKSKPVDSVWLSTDEALHLAQSLISAVRGMGGSR